MPSHLGLGDRFFSREGGITLLIKISHYAGFFVILRIYVSPSPYCAIANRANACRYRPYRAF